MVAVFGWLGRLRGEASGASAMEGAMFTGLKGDAAKQFANAKRQAADAYEHFKQCNQARASASELHINARPGAIGSTGIVALDAFERCACAFDSLKACAPHHLNRLDSTVLLHGKVALLRMQLDGVQTYLVDPSAYPGTEEEVRKFADAWCADLRAWGITPPEFDCSSFRAVLTTLASFGV